MTDETPRLQLMIEKGTLMSVMKDLVEDLVRTIVSEDAHLEVTVEEGRYQTTFKIRTSDAEVGRLLGKKGRTIGAIRFLVDLIGQKAGQHYTVWVDGGWSPSTVGLGLGASKATALRAA